MANRIKFEFLQGIRKTEEELLTIIQSTCPDVTPIDCYVTRLFGLVTFVNTPNIDKLLKPDIIDKFTNHKLKPKPHQQYYTDRTLFAHNIRPYITNYPAIEIIDSIHNQNKDILVDSIFVVPTQNNYRHIIKITFKTTQVLERALVQGLWIKGILIEPQHLSREKTEQIKQCFRCFSFEHVTNKCNSKEQYCSICSEQHNYKQCPYQGNKEKTKCKLCLGNHIAIAKSCPKRKEAIQALNNLKQQQLQNDVQINTIPSTSTRQQNEQFPSLRTRQPILNTPGEPNTGFWTQRKQQQQQQQNQSQHNQPQKTQQSQQQQQQPPITDQYHAHEWEIKLSITKSYAEMASKGNPEKFLGIMNQFLINVGLSPLELNTSQESNVTPQSQYSATSTPAKLPSLTPVSQCAFHNTPLTRTIATTPNQHESNSYEESTPEQHNRTIVVRQEQDTTNSSRHNAPSPQDMYNTSSERETDVTENTTPNTSPIHYNSGYDSSDSQSPKLRISTSTEHSPSNSNNNEEPTDTDTDIDSSIPSNQLTVRPKTRNQNARKTRTKKQHNH